MEYADFAAMEVDALGWDYGVNYADFASANELRRGIRADRTCKFCNRNGFYWKETDRGWRLFDDNDEMHRCESHPKAKARAARKREERGGEREMGEAAAQAERWRTRHG